jgi:hypothetical protein
MPRGVLRIEVISWLRFAHTKHLQRARGERSPQTDSRYGEHSRIAYQGCASPNIRWNSIQRTYSLCWASADPHSPSQRGRNEINF